MPASAAAPPSRTRELPFHCAHISRQTARHVWVCTVHVSFCLFDGSLLLLFSFMPHRPGPGWRSRSLSVVRKIIGRECLSSSAMEREMGGMGWGRKLGGIDHLSQTSPARVSRHFHIAWKPDQLCLSVPSHLLSSSDSAAPNFEFLGYFPGLLASPRLSSCIAHVPHYRVWGSTLPLNQLVY